MIFDYDGLKQYLFGPREAGDDLAFGFFENKNISD